MRAALRDAVVFTPLGSRHNFVSFDNRPKDMLLGPSCILLPRRQFDLSLNCMRIQLLGTSRGSEISQRPGNNRRLPQAVTRWAARRRHRETSNAVVAILSRRHRIRRRRRQAAVSITFTSRDGRAIAGSESRQLVDAPDLLERAGWLTAHRSASARLRSEFDLCPGGIWQRHADRRLRVWSTMRLSRRGRPKTGGSLTIRTARRQRPDRRDTSKNALDVVPAARRPSKSP